MSQVATPVIALFEDRPKQGMVYQLNLSVYLDARVVFVKSLAELSAAIAASGGLSLVIARAQFQGSAIAAGLADACAPRNIPLISLGAGEIPGAIPVSDDTQVKPLLQAAAKILGITAAQMVGKERPESFEIAPDFLNLLFTVPCDIFAGDQKVFSLGDIVDRSRVASFIESRQPLCIPSHHRLRLANAVAEQNLKATKELLTPGLGDEKKIAILSSSLDMVAAQFRSSGMDEETVALANSSIQAIETIASSSPSVNSLVKKIMESRAGYRFSHSQLLTFLGFHVIKMMGWWGDDQRNIVAQAAFYHDICLPSDAEARLNSVAELKASGLKDPASIEAVLSHAQAAARELQTVPDINSEVVRVVLQHHGSTVGRGFAQDLTKLEPLSKAFVLSEEWASYLIGLSETGREPNNEARIAELKERYKDPVAQQIAETFLYLDPELFTRDFLLDPGAMEIKVPGGKAKAKLEELRAKRLAKQGLGFGEADSVLVLPGTEAVPEPEKKFGGVTEHITLEKIAVKSAADPILTEEEEIIVKSAPAVVDKSVTVFKADAPVEPIKEMKIKSLSGSSELMKFALAGSLAEATALLDASPSITVDLRKSDADGRTALHYGAMGGDVTMLKYLLEKGSALNVVDAKRRSPLFLAAMHRKLEAFEFLLAQGAKVNQQSMGGMTIAMIGAFSGKMIVLKAAVEKGVRLETKDHTGKSALDYAKQGRHLEAVAYIEAQLKPAAKVPEKVLPSAASS